MRSHSFSKIMISANKIIFIIFFFISSLYLYLSYNIPIHAFDLEAPFNAATFPKFVGISGIIISLLFLFLPEASKPNVDYKNLDFKNTIILIILMIFYGFFIQRVGFLISTSLFLIIAFYVLGERRKIILFFFSFPFVAIFMFLLIKGLDIYLRDPFLKWMGLIG